MATKTKTKSPSNDAAPADSSTEYGDNPKEQYQSYDVDTKADLTLEEVKAKFATAKKYVDLNFRQLWDDCYAVYKRRRVMRHYEGVSDPVIPESFSIIETLVSNIAGGDPTFHFVKTNEDQPDDASVLNGMVDYYTACNQMGLKTQEWVREMLLYGTAILHITWVDGKPYIENIPLRDFFVDPNAKAMTDSDRPVARYAGFQYLADRSVLEAATIYDAETDSWKPKYSNLDQVGIVSSNDQTGGGKFMDKIYKDMFIGSTLGDDAMKSQVHVVLLYDLDSGKLVEVGNFNQIIYQDDIPYQREEQTRKVQAPDPADSTGQRLLTTTQTMAEIEPFIPFAVLRDYIDTSLFYGEGEMAVLIDRAEMLNDLEAMDTDNIAYQNTPMYQIDPQFSDLATEIETIPGAVYPIPKGALTPIERPQLGQDLDIKKDRVIAQMRSATAADEAVQGIGQDKGRVTATEVSTEIGQAQNRFSTKTKNLQDEGFTQLGSIIRKMIQIFVDEPKMVRVMHPKGAQFLEYDPWLYKGEWEAHVELDSTIKQKQLEVGQKLNQVYQIMSKSDIYDPTEFQRFIVQHLDPDITDERFNKLLATQPPGPSIEEKQQQVELQKAEKMAIANIYRFATPFIQAQIEQILNMQPDPQHEVDENHNAVKLGAEQADLLNPHTTADNTPDPSVPPVQPATPPPGLQPAGA